MRDRLRDPHALFCPFLLSYSTVNFFADARELRELLSLAALSAKANMSFLGKQPPLFASPYLVIKKVQFLAVILFLLVPFLQSTGELYSLTLPSLKPGSTGMD